MQQGIGAANTAEVIPKYDETNEEKRDYYVSLGESTVTAVFQEQTELQTHDQNTECFCQSEINAAPDVKYAVANKMASHIQDQPAPTNSMPRCVLAENITIALPSSADAGISGETMNCMNCQSCNDTVMPSEVHHGPTYTQLIPPQHTKEYTVDQPTAVHAGGDCPISEGQSYSKESEEKEKGEGTVIVLPRSLMVCSVTKEQIISCAQSPGSPTSAIEGSVKKRNRLHPSHSGVPKADAVLTDNVICQLLNDDAQNEGAPRRSKRIRR
jgi:hypothetical protein